MSQCARRKLVEAEVVDPAALDNSLRDQLFRDLYRVHERIFAGVTFEVFRHYLERPEAVRTRIQLYRSTRAELVGYCAVHVFEVRSRGRLRAIFRAEAGLLPAYRGSASTLWFGAKESFRYKLRHPFRPIVFFAMPVHPSSFHLISKFFWRCYPHPLRHMPDKWRRTLLELVDTSDAPPADRNDPLIRYVGWVTRDSQSEVDNWRRSNFEDVKYYISRNPGYSRGNGLAMIAPLSLANLAVSFLLYVTHKVGQVWARE